MYDENENENVPENPCVNCETETHVPDDKTGLIHTTGKYACFLGKRRLETVAEVSN